MCVHRHRHATNSACGRAALTMVYPEKLQRHFPSDLQICFLWVHVPYKSQPEGTKPGLINVQDGSERSPMRKGHGGSPGWTREWIHMLGLQNPQLNVHWCCQGMKKCKYHSGRGSAGVGRQEAAVKADVCKHWREMEITEQFAGGRNGKKN